MTQDLFQSLHADRGSLLRDRRADELADAEHAEMQAGAGPFFPDRNITQESLLQYAAACRDRVADLDQMIAEEDARA